MQIAVVQGQLRIHACLVNCTPNIAHRLSCNAYSLHDFQLINHMHTGWHIPDGIYISVTWKVYSGGVWTRWCPLKLEHIHVYMSI